jgi:hypothetical protein
MSELMCLFLQCRWRFIVNADNDTHEYGIYQCTRCKNISIGSPR